MARSRMKPKTQVEFVLFDVLYADGTRSSNRKVARAALSGLEGDAPAHAILEAQDQEIAARSGRAKARIKVVTRSRQKVPAK
jgi:ATP-dependent DNA ligase